MNRISFANNIALVLILAFSAPSTVMAQPSGSVPTLVSFSGVLTDGEGKAISGVAGVTFSLFKEQQGGVALWTETQNVQLDRAGHYTVMLGSAGGHGLPAELFASGEARWLGVQVQGQSEEPRIMLLAVPYALKAGDAQTIGGLPASAFVLAAPIATTFSPDTNSPSSGSGAPPSPCTSLTSDGTASANQVGKFTGPCAIEPSAITENGGKVGIGTAAPLATLDVKGTATVRGVFTLPSTGTATATAGKNSQPINLSASSFNSGTSKAVVQTFQWQAEATGNNTATPSGKLDLLFGAGGAKAGETGLNIASNGQITFASGQTFPGTGNGTITGVSAGTDLTGGGTSGSVTLNLDTTKVPQLATSNTFVGDQTITGNLTASGSITADSADFSRLSVEGVGITATANQGFGAQVYEYGDSYPAIFGSGIGSSSIGVSGQSSGGGAYGVLAVSTGTTGQGLWGETYATGSSNGAGPDGVHGVSHSSGGSGVAGTNDAAGGIAVYGRELAGGGAYAGRFDGDVWVNGNLSKNGGSFKIDHPLDPANKYLYHSFVESPDMKDIYDGVVVTDSNGDAVLTLPEWFGALNRDFRYQLTAIGQFSQAIVSRKIVNNQFSIKTDKPSVEVSWQVTGIRQDAWANSHRIPVEEIKPGDEHGTYLHPELFGAPEQSAVGYGHYRFPNNQKPHKAIAAPANLHNHGTVQSRLTGR